MCISRARFADSRGGSLSHFLLFIESVIPARQCASLSDFEAASSRVLSQSCLVLVIGTLTVERARVRLKSVWIYDLASTVDLNDESPAFTGQCSVRSA